MAKNQYKIILTTKFLEGPSVRRTKELMKLNRNQLQWVTGLLTGQSPKRTTFQIGINQQSHL